MSSFRHRAVIAQMPMPGAPRYEATARALEDFRASLPDDSWRALVIGPVPAVIESNPWVVFLPDGSKEGWRDSDLGDEFRERFLNLFPLYVVAEWGDGEPSARVNTEDHYIRVSGISDLIRAVAAGPPELAGADQEAMAEVAGKLAPYRDEIRSLVREISDESSGGQ